MTTYIIRRVLWAIIILIMLTLLVFFSMRLLPGDPIVIYVGQSQGLITMGPEALAELRAEYGLDKPVMVQYINWIGGIFRGDLGKSVVYKEDVGNLLGKRLPVTTHLGAITGRRLPKRLPTSSL